MNPVGYKSSFPSMNIIFFVETNDLSNTTTVMTTKKINYFRELSRVISTQPQMNL